MESRDQDRRILPISIVKVLVEDGTDVIASTVQTADTIVNAEKDRRPSLRVVEPARIMWEM
jgi:hypothetical protein